MAPIFAQSTDEVYQLEGPWTGPPLQLDAWEGADQPPPGEALASDLPVDVDLPAPQPEIPLLSEFLGYRYEARSVGWIMGNGDQFGMVSLESEHYVSHGVETGLGVGLKFHFLGGPEKTDMPPRVFDFSIGL